MKRVMVLTMIVFHLCAVLHTVPLQAQEELKIVHEPVIEVAVQKAISVTAELTGSAAGKLVYIMYRQVEKKNFTSISMKNVGENAFAGEIPSKKVTSEGLEYYLRVIDPIGNQLARYPVDESYIKISVIPVKVVEELTLPEEETVTLAEEKPVIVPERQKKTGLKKWHWIGIGSLVVVGIAAIAMSGGGGDGGNGGQTYTKLPDPPDRP